MTLLPGLSHPALVLARIAAAVLCLTSTGYCLFAIHCARAFFSRTASGKAGVHPADHDPQTRLRPRPEHIRELRVVLSSGLPRIPDPLRGAARGRSGHRRRAAARARLSRRRHPYRHQGRIAGDQPQGGHPGGPRADGSPPLPARVRQRHPRRPDAPRGTRPAHGGPGRRCRDLPLSLRRSRARRHARRARALDGLPAIGPRRPEDRRGRIRHGLRNARAAVGARCRRGLRRDGRLVSPTTTFSETCSSGPDTAPRWCRTSSNTSSPPRPFAASWTTRCAGTAGSEPFAPAATRASSSPRPCRRACFSSF